MREVGIPLQEAERILEFEDAGEYIEQVIKTKRCENIRLAMIIANACRIAYHADKNEYITWIQNMQAELNQLSNNDSDDELTVFERLKKERKMKETLFDVLKRQKRGKQ